MATKTSTKNARMLYLREQYLKEHDTDVVDAHAIARWAIKKRLWTPPESSPELLLSRYITRAMRTDYYTDPQGREVRRFHPVLVPKVGSPGRIAVWADMQEAKPEHMRVSFQQRRRSALNDVKQLSLDFDSFNENNRFGATLPPMNFDFNADLEEARMPASYPEEPDGDDGDRSED